MQVNVLQKEFFSNKISQYYNDNLKGKKFAMWRLAFKPKTDDIREAPALEIIARLVESGASVTAFDPEAMPNVKKETKVIFDGRNLYDTEHMKNKGFYYESIGRGKVMA